MEDSLIAKIHKIIKNNGALLSESEISEAINFVRDLPNQLNVINVTKDVFEDVSTKNLFESVFKEYDSFASFVYLPSFKRVRVIFTDSESAFLARVKTPGWTPYGYDQSNERNKSFDENSDSSDLIETVPQEDGFLKLPQQTKLFLLSPPASPPVGWEPRVEAEPVTNFELLAALASLQPNTTHELHPPSEEDNQPAIVITTAEAQEDEFEMDLMNKSELKIQHTRCPDRAHNDENI